MYATAQQARLSVNLVASERTVATTDTQIHIHHQQIVAVDKPRTNQLFLGAETALSFLGVGLQERTTVPQPFHHATIPRWPMGISRTSARDISVVV